MFGFFGGDPAHAITAVAARSAVANEGAVLVDVREDDEFRSGHIRDSISMPLSRFAREAGRLPKNKPVILVCHSGMRSAQALAQARKAGVMDVRNLSGGLLAWRRAGLSL